MNYIIEDDFDFYKELNNNDNVNDSEELCLISHEPLIRENTIKLLCGHKFNYLPLFKEIMNQKKKHNILEVKRLSVNQLKCPYCRNIQNRLLPYIPQIKGVGKVWGVNHPEKWEMKNYLYDCNYVFKSGKKKGLTCGKRSLHEKCIKHSNVCPPVTNNSISLDTLNKYTCPQLKKICKLMNLKKYSKLRKNELLELIKNDLNKD